MKWHAFTFSLVTLFLAGCAPLPPIPPDSAATAQCPVCRHDRDLACLNVVKTEATPKLTREGRTYYFCSEKCRQKCAGNPAKFIQDNP